MAFLGNLIRFELISLEIPLRNQIWPCIAQTDTSRELRAAHRFSVLGSVADLAALRAHARVHRDRIGVPPLASPPDAVFRSCTDVRGAQAWVLGWVPVSSNRGVRDSEGTTNRHLSSVPKYGGCMEPQQLLEVLLCASRTRPKVDVHSRAAAAGWRVSGAATSEPYVA